MSDKLWFQTQYAGRTAEQAVARWFRRRGWRPFAACGSEAFDLLLMTKIEVKHDLAAPATGHVAIEVESRGRPSGIVTSQADYWVLVFAEQAVVVRTSTLRERVLAGGLRRQDCGEDGSTVVCLLPVDQLVQLAGAQWIELGEG
ncbi:MAG TPA: hypothetical protein VGX78_18030 [Pirellulales bacterium]|jgi:hypothetical protein|nr:hypothetical protein [Pirellulales bacterium]